MMSHDFDHFDDADENDFDRPYTPSRRPFICKFCQKQIRFEQRKPFNMDGTQHKCQAAKPSQDEPAPHQATLFAMAAMNAIINGQIQAGGVDHIHRMNFQDVADASWRCAAAMVKGEKQYRFELGGFA